jgi:hypothetical protein
MQTKIILLYLLFSSFSMSSFSQNIDLDSGLLLYYPFYKNDGNQILDYSGNGYHGFAMNGAKYSSDVLNQSEKAFEFDGVDDYILTTDFGSHYPEKEATVSFWAKANIFKSANVYWLNTGSQTNRISGEVMYSHNGSNVCFMDHGNITSSGRLSYSYSFDSSWHHYVYVHSAQNKYMELFIDGKSVRRMSSSSEFKQTKVDLLIGAAIYLGNATLFFNGKIDEFRIYDRILNSVEIEELSDKQTLSIRDIAKTLPHFNIYPNPNNGEWKVQLSKDARDVSFELYNLMGQKVNTSVNPLGVNTYAIKSDDVAPGMYFLRIISDKGIHTAKLQIQ